MNIESPTGLLAEFKVTEKQAGSRLDRFLQERIPKLSRVRIQEAIRTRVEVVSQGGRGPAKPSLRVRPGDLVRIRGIRVEEPPFPAHLVPAILYEDEALIAVDKPAGLPVHATRRVVSNQLVSWLRGTRGPEVALAHRLDRETSGVVLSTRGAEVARRVGRAFAQGRVHKEYLAVVFGVPPEAFESDLPVGKDPRSAVHIKQAAGVETGSPSRTRFRREEVSRDGSLALVRAFPETGRRHQIRVHLGQAGYPVVGDKLYALGEHHFLNFAARGLSPRMLRELGAARHLLHAAVLELDHPVTGERLRLEAPIPSDLRAALGEVP